MPTPIEWTDETWNPTTGCSKLTQGCKNCYAKREWGRLKHNPGTVYYGREFEDVRTHPERLETPRQWSRPRRIFVDSMSDLWHDAIPDAFIVDVLAVARDCAHHTFQILTKRAARMCAFFEQHGPPTANVMVGVSCEDQMTWDERIPLLLRAPLSGRFASLEPLLGMIDGRGCWTTEVDVTSMGASARQFGRGAISVPPARDWPLAALDWVIVGGESGPQARPMHSKWARWLRDQCDIVDVPFFFKQWGEWLPDGQQRLGLVVRGRPARAEFGDGTGAWRVGKKPAGRMLDGKHHDGQIT